MTKIKKEGRTMETIPYIAIILAICGGIITIIGAAEKIVNAGKFINSPNMEQDKRLDALEARCDKYDRYFDSDKQRLADLEQSLSVLMQSQFALLSHAINGNDTDKLKTVRDTMLEYLTKRGISV